MPEDVPREENASFGRPTEYKVEYAAQAEKLCKLGATDPDLADFFGVNRTTIWRWSNLYEDFCNATKTGKTPANERVKRSLYQRACGFEYEEKKVVTKMVKIGEAQTEAEITEETTTTKFLPPETGACAFWLKNRDGENWRDKPNNEADEEIPSMSVVIGEVDARKQDGESDSE